MPFRAPLAKVLKTRQPQSVPTMPTSLRWNHHQRPSAGAMGHHLRCWSPLPCKGLLKKTRCDTVADAMWYSRLDVTQCQTICDTAAEWMWYSGRKDVIQWQTRCDSARLDVIQWQSGCDTVLDSLWYSSRLGVVQWQSGCDTVAD